MLKVITLKRSNTKANKTSFWKGSKCRNTDSEMLNYCISFKSVNKSLPTEFVHNHYKTTWRELIEQVSFYSLLRNFKVFQPLYFRRQHNWPSKMDIKTYEDQPEYKESALAAWNASQTEYRNTSSHSPWPTWYLSLYFVPWNILYKVSYNS